MILEFIRSRPPLKKVRNTQATNTYLDTFLLIRIRLLSHDHYPIIMFQFKKMCVTTFLCFSFIYFHNNRDYDGTTTKKMFFL